ncbi:MAG: hemagglutinin repeat-containing protein [Pseudomonas sp.]|nr:hemagglutinin repeat-containing protein [Pseudomonas sp.]
MRKDKRHFWSSTSTTQYGSDVQVGGDLSAEAGRDVAVIASKVKAGGDIALDADGDVRIASAANESSSEYRYKSSKKKINKEDATVRQQGAVIEAGGNFISSSGGDTNLTASQITAGQEAYLYAKGDINLDTAQNQDYSYYYKKKKSEGLFSSKTKTTMSEAANSQAVSSSIRSGSDLTLVANNDIAVRGAQLSSDEIISLYAGRNILIDAAENTANQADAKAKSSLFSSKSSNKSSASTSLTSTSLDGKNVELLADNDITLRAAAVHAENGIILDAGRDIAISTAQQSQQSSQASKSNKLNWHLTDSLATNGSFTLENKGKGGQQSSVQEVGTTLSGATIDIDSGRDTSIRASTLVADHNIRIDAGRNLSVVSGETSNTSSATSKTKNTGEIGNWYQGATGVASLKETNQNSSVTQTASQIASLGGNVALKAGERYTQVASHVIAPTGDISIIGKQVNIEAGYDKLSESQKQSSNRTAIGGSVSVPLVDAVRNIQQMGNAAENTGDARLKSLAAVNVAMNAQRGYEAAQAMGTGDFTGIKVSVNLSNNKGSSSSSQSGQNVVGSTIAAGGDVNISAVGDGKNSNLNVVGSQIDAMHNVNLKAGGDISLLSAQNTAQQRGDNANNGWSVGVGFNLGSQNGFTIDLAANKGKGSSDGESATHSNTAVRAGDTVNITSGEDTNLKGAVVSANQVKADVGGDFNLVSLQDIDNYKSKQQDASVGISLCIPPFCYGMSSSGTASFGQQKIDSTYASVVEQTGIKAGDGGFQINVAGNTDLQGAVIASTDKAVADGKNSLSTGTLTHSDVKNEAEYKGTSISLSGGYSGNAYDKEGNVIKGADGKPLHEPGVTAGTPIVLSASGEDGSKTLSGISGGQITITDAAKQQQLTGESAEEVVAGINRDVSSDKDGSNTLGKIFDQEEIEAGFEITHQFVQNVGTFLDDRAKQSTNDKKELEAEQAKPADEQDGQKMAALILAIEDNKTWDVGGTGRALVSALSGAAGSNVTGGTTQMLQGAAINYLQGLAAEQVKNISDELDSEVARTALHAIVGCGGAAAQNQSCSSGAIGAGASVVLNNLLDALNNDKSATEEEKQTRLNLIGSLIAGITSATGGDASAASNAAQIETANNHLSDHEMRELAQELKGCEQRKDCTSIAQAYNSKHLVSEETFEKVCEVSTTACRLMAAEMNDAVYKFQTLGYYVELGGQTANILYAFHQKNLQAQQDAAGTMTVPTAEAMVIGAGYDPNSEKAKALIATMVAFVAGKAASRGPKGAVTAPKVTIRDHYDHHLNMVDDIKDQLSAQGYRVSNKEISFGSSCGVGRCRPDIVAEAPDGSIRIIEVKTGSADLSIRQSEIFPQIRDGSSIPRGKVARDFGLIPGKPLREQGYPNGIPVETMNFPGAK